MKYKKGQLIPKYLGCTCRPQKVRHMARFGTDVIVESGIITALAPGPVIEIKQGWIGGRNGRPRRYGHFTFNNLHVVGYANALHPQTTTNPAFFIGV